MIISKKFLDKILTFLVIALSGFPFFSTGKEPMVIVASVIIAIGMIYLKDINIRKTDLLPFWIFIILTTCQLFILKQYDFMAFMGIFLSIIVSWLYIKIVSLNFFRLYVKILFILSLISLFFYFLFIVAPDFRQFLLRNVTPYFHRAPSSAGYSYSDNIIIMNIKSLQPYSIFTFGYRNPGPFWEAGAMGLYTNLALFFNLFLFNKKILHKENIILFLTVLTTFSTASYIVLFYLIIGYEYFLKKRKLKNIIYILLTVYSFFILYNNTPFLKEKVGNRVVSYNSAINIDTKQERIGTFYKDINYLSKNPVVGYGADVRNRITGYQGTSIKYNHKNNGISNILLILGFPIGFLYILNFGNLIKFITTKKNIKAYIFIVLFFILLTFSQIVLTKLVFLSLFWIAWLDFDKINGRNFL